MQDFSTFLALICSIQYWALIENLAIFNELKWGANAFRVSRNKISKAFALRRETENSLLRCNREIYM